MIRFCSPSKQIIKAVPLNFSVVPQIDLQWFAAEDEGRTEDPTETRLRKAREEGQIAKSQELNGALVFLFTVVLLIALAPWMENKFKEILIFYFNNILSPHVDDSRFFYAFARYFLLLAIPFSVVGAIAGIAANLIQNKGFIFTLKTIRPNFKKIVPDFIKYFKNTVFSLKGLFNIAKSIGKVTVIALVAYALIKKDLDTTLTFLKTAGPESAVHQVGLMVSKLLVICAVILLGISILDYLMQRRTFKEEMKMKVQEVKEEMKEQEGDPVVKGHLQQAQRELLSRNMPQAVRESDVVITNPTHYAVSLKYGEDYEAPEVTAKGVDNTALTIKKIAKEADVPIIENRPLARSLYAETQIGDIIPVSYMAIIANIYAQIGYMDKKQKKA